MPWIYYFGWHTPSFNHDIVQIPLWVAIALAAWRAVETQKIVWWIGLGALSALVLYGKLSAVLILVATALWLLTDPVARATLRTPGPWAALAVFLAAIIPLTMWLFGGEATPLDYAVKRGTVKSKSLLEFSAIQLAIAVGVLIPVALIDASKAFWPAPVLPVSRHSANAKFKSFLMMLTIGPIAIALAGAAIAGTGAKLMWGVPMLSLTGLIVVTLLPERWTAIPLPRLTALSCLFSAGLALVHGATMLSASSTNNTSIKRSQWPQAEISNRLRHVFWQETGRKLTIVAGDQDNWLASLIAVSKDDILDVYTAADTQLAPWITAERAEKEGVLVVWQYPECGPPEDLVPLLSGKMAKIESFAVPVRPTARPLSIGYAVYTGNKSVGNLPPPLPSNLSLLPLR